MNDSEKGASQKQWHYTDLLAAAWMAKHFGMRFIHDWKRNRFGEPCEFNGVTGILLAIAEFSPIFNIHPDSLPLLEARVGDTAVDSWGNFWDIEKNLDDGRAYFGDGHFGERKDLKLVQRDGKPFMWPECLVA